METRLQALEEKVTRLAERVDQLEQRLAAAPPPTFPPVWPSGELQLPGVPAGAETARWVTLLGRSCVVLGGAFLLRALTDSHLLPTGIGVALGILFAAAWVFLAHRAGAGGARLSAAFHAVTAAVIAYPLILETTARLGAMSAPVAALTLVGFTALLLLVSWRDALGWLAWTGVLSCLLTALVLLRVTQARAEFTAVLLVLAAATFWLGDRPGWGGLRWLPALALDLVIGRAVLGFTPPLLFDSLALACLSLALVLSRTAALARPVGAFEVFQTVAGLAIGLAGALRALVEAGQGTGVLAGGVVAAALLAFAFAGWIIPRRGDREPDFLFYSVVSLGLLSFAVALLAGDGLRGVLWSTLALVTVLLGRRRQAGPLWAVAALLAWGGALAAGLLGTAWQALAGREPGPWPAPSAGSVVALGLVTLAYLATILAPRSSAVRPAAAAPDRLPPAALLFLAGAGLAAAILEALGPLTSDAARAATARTLVAVALALSLALIRRRMACPELKWIAYLALVLGGLELVVQGLPSGQPLLLLISFVVYGAGLIAVPRLAPPGREGASSSGPG
ncbi:MAG TPA: hypothetical protein VEJ89_03460 [Myxococcaceae bacterium]|nr:hypothetical protein [Myxococcaceae bacterium]